MALLVATASAAGERVSALEVEAAFVRNFARYVGWPRAAFTDDAARWRVCIVGPEEVATVVGRTLAGRREQGRAFEVVWPVSTVTSCQVVFVSGQDAATRAAVLAQVKTLPVLTVGDAPGFLEEGGVLRFQVREHVELSVNLDQARAVSLQIPTRMLEVAREVVENGTTHKVH